MRNRWRGGRALLATLTAALLLAATATLLSGGSAPALRVSLPDGRVVARLPLEDGTLALRYRNSLYGTIAEERFVVTDDGRMRLVRLAAEQIAVLEEYYAIDTPARPVEGDGLLRWEADPAHVPVERTLRVAATDRGERTVHVDGVAPLELWRLVDDSAPHVLLEVEP